MLCACSSATCEPSGVASRSRDIIAETRLVRPNRPHKPLNQSSVLQLKCSAARQDAVRFAAVGAMFGQFVAGRRGNILSCRDFCLAGWFQVGLNDSRPRWDIRGRRATSVEPTLSRAADGPECTPSCIHAKIGLPCAWSRMPSTVLTCIRAGKQDVLSDHGRQSVYPTTQVPSARTCPPGARYSEIRTGENGASVTQTVIEQAWNGSRRYVRGGGE